MRPMRTHNLRRIGDRLKSEVRRIEAIAAQCKEHNLTRYELELREYAGYFRALVVAFDDYVDIKRDARGKRRASPQRT